MSDITEAFPHTVHGLFTEPSYDVQRHDEADIYGTPHQLVYSRYEKPMAHIVIEFTQGGALQQNEGRVHVRAALLGLGHNSETMVIAGRYPYETELTEDAARTVGDSLVKLLSTEL